MKNLFKSKKGFTLVEMIVVIVIIAILAAALVVSLIGYINKAKQANFQTEASNAYTAAQAYLSEQLGMGKTVTTDNAAALKTAVDELVGAPVGNNITALTYDDDGTISAFTYAKGGFTISYTTAAGWSTVGGDATNVSGQAVIGS